MGNPLRRGWLALAAWLALSGAAVAQAPLAVSRLTADAPSGQVTQGMFDADFVRVPGTARLAPGSPGAQWWRVTATGDIAAAGEPHLVVANPHLNWLEAWRPGDAAPQPRSALGANADRSYAARALVLALPHGLRAGQSVYLRVHVVSPVAMPVGIEPRALVHRRDLVHVAWRTAVLVTMLVLALLAFGFWLGGGERGFAWLMVALLAQVGFLAVEGGEIRLLPWLANLLGQDLRAGRLFGAIGAIASIGFLDYYLDLSRRQPRVMAVLKACGVAMALVVVATFFTLSPAVALVANAVLIVAVGATVVATATAARRRERAAWFLALSSTPLLVVVVWRVGGLVGAWPMPDGLAIALPVVLALSGLLLTLGLSDKMQQLRRDRDRASELAAYDGLTGAASRQMIEEQLAAAVASAHRQGQPLSVVFFDIDHFKRINDEHGHLVGDHCLRVIALRTRNRLRSYDRLGRYGGDELLVILPDTRLGEAFGVAENLRSAVNCRPLSINGARISASLSLGVAELAAGESAHDLLQRADAALYASKANGRDRVTAEAAPTAPSVVPAPA
ncbi:MAG: diguanylate cyclase [Pseudomonas sp.]|nr:diguanylate cyclase [Pseudomonas sp.]